MSAFCRIAPLLIKLWYHELFPSRSIHNNGSPKPNGAPNCCLQYSARYLYSKYSPPRIYFPFPLTSPVSPVQHLFL